ncbi:MAG: RNase adapter RapZ [Firmicutes bacterium]|nr:RNase adapter RapZ [Bacillota bacterium]
MKDLRLVIVTGLSGAGKTQAIKSLEDLGFFCVDNLPPAFITKMAELCIQSDGKISRVALGIDLRGGEFFGSTLKALEELEEAGFPYQILFLEASDDVLVRRFKETRRRHPLAPQGRILEGIREERERLQALRGHAPLIIDTSDLSPSQLREQVVQIFAGEQQQQRLIVTVVSFGFKFGLPLDADLVFDVRFLPNPHYVESLRPHTGRHPAVREYVERWPITRKFMRRLIGMVEFLLPHYISEGKTQLAIAVGCTGGKHRSVVVAEHLAQSLRQKGYTVLTEHRDADRTEARETGDEGQENGDDGQENGDGGREAGDGDRS